MPAENLELPVSLEMPNTWCVADVCQELQDMASYLKKRRQLQLPEPATADIVKGIVFKMKSMGDWTSSSASTVLDACALLSDDAAKIITTTVDDLVMATPDAASLHCLQNTSTCIFMHNYLSAEDWKLISSRDESLLAKKYCIIRKMKKLGMKSVSEQTVRWIIALLLTTLDTLPRYHIIYQMVLDFKKLFHSEQTMPFQCTTIKTYPKDAASLPADVYKAVYTDAGQMPAPHQPTALPAIAMHHIPLRPTSKLLIKEREDEAKAAAHATAPLASVAAPQASAVTAGLDAMVSVSERLLKLTERLALPGAATTPKDEGHVRLELVHGGRAVARPMLPSGAPEMPESWSPPKSADTAPGHVGVPLAAAEPFRPKLRELGAPTTALSADKRADSEEIETEAFEKLLKRPAAAKKKALKRPASAEAENSELGCPSCRFGANGCRTCKKPGYRRRGA